MRRGGSGGTREALRNRSDGIREDITCGPVWKTQKTR